jgi:hypothetical protein
MSAKDKFHNLVRIALEKDGWAITDDPSVISRNQIPLLVYDTEKQEVSKWIS